MRRPLPTAIAVALATLIGCGDDGPTTQTTTEMPTTTEAPPEDNGALAIATFEVAGDETYKVELITPELVEHAEGLLAGEPLSAIPNGQVVRDDPGVNEPWSWHIDPGTFEFAFATTEVCDGIPSFVEDGTVTSDFYCPWSAIVIDVERT